MSKHRTRAMLWLVGTTVFATFATVWYLVNHLKEKLLLGQATRIDARTELDSFVCLAGGEYLLIRHTKKLRDAQRRFFEDELIIMNSSGHQTHARELTHWYNSLTRPFNFDITASRDGKWLLACQDTNFYTGTAITSHDGLVSRQYPKEYRFSGYEALWADEGSHWVEFPSGFRPGQTSQGFRHSTRTSERTQMKFRLPKDLSASPDSTAIAENGSLVGVSWFDPPGSPPRAHVDFIRVSADEAQQASTVFHVPKPANQEIEYLLISPDGERTAWFLRYAQTDPLRDLLRRLFPWVKSNPFQVIALWVSKSDGSELQEIGHIRTTSSNDQTPENVQWDPNGKRIAFSIGHILYSVLVLN